METFIMVVVLATGLFALVRALPVLFNQRDPGAPSGGGPQLRPVPARVPRRRRR